MRILAVTPYYEPEGGGLERYAHEILKRHVARGHDVQVVTFTHRAPGSEEHDGVAVERRRPWFFLGNAPIDPTFRTLVAKRLARDRPDVVLAHTPVPFPAEMAFMASRSLGVPFVVTYHSGRLRGSTGLLDRLASVYQATLERRMLAGATRLIAVGPYVRDHALGRERDRVTIIPPGVDTGQFSPNGDTADGRQILFVGPLDRSYRWKGADVLLAAFARVRQQRPEMRLVLVGHGDRFAEFVRRGRKFGVSVHLLGRLTNHALADVYRNSAIVTLPSTTDAESFGLVLAEANACGRPVVASRVGGIPDFVRDGENGLLAKPGDPWDLAEKILRLVEEPGLAAAMGGRARERVVREHDWDKLAERTEGVLSEAVAAGPH